jgi:cytochrome c oxidase subunit 2
MGLVIVLILIVVAAVLFQFLSPWWLTPVGSNRGHIDDTLITIPVITGAVHAINLPNQPGPPVWS